MLIKPSLLLIASTIRLGGVASFAIRPAGGHFSSLNSVSSYTQLAMSSTTTTDTSWSDLQSSASNTSVGAALNTEQQARDNGTGAAFVQSKLRLFGSTEK